jgi:N-acylneuraminate cytidylyltransferase
MNYIIPLRSGSKRLKNKNVIEFYGKPIFAYPLGMVTRSGLFDKIILAIDTEYNELAWHNYYGNMVYLRQQQNSVDASPLIDLVREVVDAYKITDNEMCILYGTSVLTTKEQLKKGIDRLRKGDIDCVFPVVKQENELLADEGIVVKNWETYEGFYKHADAWFMFNVNKVLKTNQIIQDENGYIELKDYQAQAVHTAEDIEDLKYKYAAMKANK